MSSSTWAELLATSDRVQDEPSSAPEAIRALRSAVETLQSLKAPLALDDRRAVVALVASGSAGLAALLGAAEGGSQRAFLRSAFQLRTTTARLAAELARVM